MAHGCILSEYSAGLADMLSNLQLERQLLDRHQQWRSLIGVVQPSPQVAIYGQLLPQQGNEGRQAPAMGALQLQVLQNQHGDERRPDLNLHRVLAGTDEGLDLQALLESLEEELSGKGLARC